MRQGHVLYVVCFVRLREMECLWMSLECLWICLYGCTQTSLHTYLL